MTKPLGKRPGAGSGRPTGGIVQEGILKDGKTLSVMETIRSFGRTSAIRISA
jgi:hypothetical protein